MQQQVGLAGLEQRLRSEAASWSEWLPQLPRLLHQALVEAPQRDAALQAELRRLRLEAERRNRLLLVGATALVAAAAMLAWIFLGFALPGR
jgi:ubiquinone biosynthesis protein